MAQFKVEFDYTVTQQITVEAKTKKEALEIAQANDFDSAQSVPVPDQESRRKWRVTKAN